MEKASKIGVTTHQNLEAFMGNNEEVPLTQESYADPYYGVQRVFEQKESSPEIEEIGDCSCAEHFSERDFLVTVSPRDTVWDSHRASADSVQAIYARSGSEFERYATRISECAGRLFFGWALVAIDAIQKLILVGAEFCRVRHCPICQWRRSLMWKARFYKKIPDLLAIDEYKNSRFIFLTLTVKNCHITELSDTLKHMNKSWNRLINNRKIKKIITGYVRTTEVTRGKDFDMNAHPHFHVLFMVPSSYFGSSYIKQSDWIELWRDAARLDYAPNVDIRAVKWETNATQEQKISSLNQAVIETLKYSVKPSDMTGSDSESSDSDSDSSDSDNDADEWFLELTRQLHKKRFIATGGALKNILREDDESDADFLLQEGDEHESLDGDISLAFDWTKPVKKYVRNRDEDRAIKNRKS